MSLSSQGQLQAALAFLQRDVLRNITMLKLLNAYGAALACSYVEHGDEAGALLQFPPALFPYDAATYPDAERIIVLSTTGPAATEALLDTVPPAGRLVFKLTAPRDQEVVARRFPLRPVSRFFSFTSPPGSVWPPVLGVGVSEELDERCLERFVAMGHDRDEVREHFRTGGAMLYTIYGDGELASTCYIYQNFGPLWEVAGVYTAPTARRSGYGAQVVAAALHTLSGRGHIPRYQVHEANLPSIRLAERLGLLPFVAIEHFVHNGMPGNGASAP
jgi:RimJ/RimL family protein N-acetyltransferase